MHADRFNRFALLVFGLIVLVAGAGALALSVGLFGTKYSHHALFDNFISTYIGDQGTWLWPAAAAVSVIIGLLAVRWIVALLVSTDRAGDLTMPGERRTGRTMLRSGALPAAVTAEIATYRGVATSKARSVEDAGVGRLVVEVTALRGADIAALTQRIEGEAFAHARTAMGEPAMPIRLDVTVGSKALPRL